MTNKTIEDFDYMNTKFAFKTVYKVSKYTYRCCPCGFEHEYLDYIGNGGEINEEMYEKIVNSIVVGQCPHVTDVNNEDTPETGIYGFAIALALGTETHWDKNDLIKDKCRSALFNVEPCMLAFKKNLTSLPISFIDYYRDSNKRIILDAQRATTNIHEIILEKRDVLELCIRNKNVKLLEEMPVYGNVDYSALRSAFQSCSEQVINAVMQKIDLTNQRKELTSRDCCRLSIIYDRPDVLQTHLGRFSSTFRIVRKDLEHILTSYCKMWERPRCKDIISKYNKYDEKQLTISEVVIKKLWLLLEFYGDVSIREEILSSLHNIKRENLTEFKKEEFLQIYSIHVDRHKKINSAAFKTVLDEAAELFALPQNDISHLDTLLEKRYSMGPAYRHVLEILLFENPELDGNRSLLKKCTGVDNGLELCSSVSEYALHTSLIMDCKQHAMFKHDNARDFALNFTAPLLIECGCPYSSDEYTAFISRYGDGAPGSRLQQAEKEFLCLIKDTQKTLAGMCRDTLRRHFKGPQIHGYVKQSNIPSNIKNFILLKDVLKYTPVDVFY